jgi:hypothetical protein
MDRSEISGYGGYPPRPSDDVLTRNGANLVFTAAGARRRRPALKCTHSASCLSALRSAHRLHVALLRPTICRPGPRATSSSPLARCPHLEALGLIPAPGAAPEMRRGPPTQAAVISIRAPLQSTPESGHWLRCGAKRRKQQGARGRRHAGHLLAAVVTPGTTGPAQVAPIEEVQRSRGRYAGSTTTATLANSRRKPPEPTASTCRWSS